MNKRINRSIGDLVIWVVKNYLAHLYFTSFTSPVFVQARDPMMQSRAIILEQVVFFGVGKHDEGLIPLMVPQEPICRRYDVNGNEDGCDNFLTEDEICGMAMRDGELSMVIAAGREVSSNGDVEWCINGWADRATPRDARVREDSIEIVYEDPLDAGDRDIYGASDPDF